ncbi:complex i intermediate-associated protein 30 [Colletotrichum truncatum]|uniref:Complex i intermediate-associated protein 30 n=1 Tax=Colletotrichum truncatum TaxID=5467 RepID=A0ACC3Z1F4_COLTU|nr:complex i intermediate-associated protein 30 [Colletotrichum truncatum]KAF6788918.1 complex i intermediate-associated protein 30 [Colletotrichum truncatum]
MRATPSLMGKGFWARSLEQFQRSASIALKAEAIKGAQGPFMLQDFRAPGSTEDCKLLSDKEIGGFSKVALDWVPFASQTHPASSSTPASESSTSTGTGYARFHGTISTELPKDNPKIQRTGFAAWRTPDQQPTMFGKSVWDIDPYVYLAMRVKSDGRSYFINLQTESVEPTDLHQHRLFTKRPGEWETVFVKWNDFVRTNHGFVIEPQTEMLRSKVTTVGIGLTDRRPGPFELCIERVWATNNLEEVEAGEAEADEAATEKARQARESELKNRQGQSIRWSTR